MQDCWSNSWWLLSASKLSVPCSCIMVSGVGVVEFVVVVVVVVGVTDQCILNVPATVTRALH